MPESLLSEFSSCSFIKKETSAQVPLSEFYEIFKNTYFLMLLPYPVPALTNAAFTK